MLDREVESLKVEVRYLRESQAELKQDIKDISTELKHITQFVTEAKFGRRWLLGMITLSAALGATIDHLCRLLKLY
jgi:hypothetical protein